MWMCIQCGEKCDDDFAVCWKCGATADGEKDQEFQVDVDSKWSAEFAEPERVQLPAPVKLYSTAFTDQPRVVIELVTGESAVQLNRDGRNSAEGLDGRQGDESNAQEMTDLIRKTRSAALSQMRSNAESLKATAIVEISIAMVTDNGWLFFSCHGTAVKSMN